jgi:2-dehydropantoate 2-reductase
MGARLALAGNEVTFLARPRVVDAIQKNDLILTEGEQSQHIQPIRATSNLDTALQDTKPDVILLCVKAYDCIEAAKSLKQVINQPIPVLSLLNGINNEKTLSDELGAENIIPATLTTAVQMIKPGVIKVAKRRGVGIGGDHVMANKLVDRFAVAGFRVEHFSNPDRMKWSKLLTNIVSNATSAITGLDPGQVFTHPGLAELEIEALREAVRVMRKLGFPPQNLPGVSVALLGNAVFLPSYIIRHILGRIVARGRGRKKPSLHFDIGRGKSEVDWLNGAVTRYGAQLGVPTPVNETINETMKSLVDDASLHALYLGNPDALLAKAYPARV